MNKKLYLPGLLPVLVAVFLVVGIFIAIHRVGYQSIYLNDTKSNHNGWEYEIRNARGGKKVVPRFIDEYNYTLSDENYDAVKRSRIMTEELADASLEMSCVQCGVEVFLDGSLLYSDFQTAERDAYGYLLIDEADIRDELRSIEVRLPEDYNGKKLTIITYFAQNTEFRYVIDPNLKSMDTMVSHAVADIVGPMLWLAFCGSMALGAAACCMVPVMDKILRFKMALLFLVYVVSFVMCAYQSDMGYYSGLQEWVGQTVVKGAFNISVAWLVLLAACAVNLLAVEIWTGRKKRGRHFFGKMMFFSAIGFVITAVQKSSELEGNIISYFPTIINSVSYGHFAPLVQMVSSVIIYTITPLTIVQFSQWRLSEWRKKARFLERSRFARENYDLVMQVNEDSRRRNHEIRHHMQTLYSLLMAQEPDGAKKYIEKVIKEADKYTEMTYSENIVLNSIVGIRLNQAKKNGIDTQCHIYAPCKLEADEVDLSILLSNMLENAMEACMRMEDRDGAYIRLEIWKKQKFLFIECENSVDRKEIPKDGQTTVKDDRKNHGFGLEAMRAVAEKYASIIQIEREPDRFTVRTNLCLPK